MPAVGKGRRHWTIMRVEDAASQRGSGDLLSCYATADLVSVELLLHGVE
jgi:hypothetical protein